MDWSSSYQPGFHFTIIARSPLEIPTYRSNHIVVDFEFQSAVGEIDEVYPQQHKVKGSL